MNLGFKPFSKRWGFFDDDTNRLLRRYLTGGPFKTNDATRDWIKQVNGEVRYQINQQASGAPGEWPYPEFWKRLRDKDMRAIDLGDGEFGNYLMS